MSQLAIVVIGRNEGERLDRCLASVLTARVPVVYVDSGSSDGSVARARSRGVTVVELDRALPFTAGRARNEGLDRLLELHPGLQLAQFVDGDCELVGGWLERGAAILAERPGVAAVCGRVRERNRDRTIYNRLCDMEWDAPAGEARSCGGNAMMRVRAFRENGGFTPGMIAGEEPDLCLRLRRSGWTILRADADMVIHDAEMTRFAQWWRRASRAGHAYAEGARLQGPIREPQMTHAIRSILAWGALLPMAVTLLAVPTHGLSLLLLAGYVVLAGRVYRGARAGGATAPDARLLAVFTVLAKFPQAIGLVEYELLRARGRRRGVVDWRQPVRPAPGRATPGSPPSTEDNQGS